MTQMIIRSVKDAMEFRRGLHRKLIRTSGMEETESEKRIKHNDVLQLMLDSDESHEQPSEARRFKLLSDAEIIANSWVFILGGFETTAAALTFTFHLLSKHQNAQEKLFSELEKSFGVR
jgi:cytochrome P450